MIRQRKNDVSMVCTKSQNSVLKTLKSNWEFLLMVLPGTLLVLVFAYLPMFGICVAFKSIDYAKGILGSPWVGLKNFEFLFGYPDAKIIFRNTLGYNFAILILGTSISVLFSLFLSQLCNKRASKVYQTIIMMPHFMSWVIVSYITFAFLSFRLGMINKSILEPFGLASIDWYAKVDIWPYLLVFLGIWKNFGYDSVVYLAAISGIDGTLYEAASIDGATRRQQMWYITIPEIASIIVIMTILAIGRILSSDFGLFYNIPMGKGLLLPVTNVINTFTYRALKVNGDIGLSSAAGFLQSVVGFILVMTTNWIVKRFDDSKALF